MGATDSNPSPSPSPSPFADGASRRGASGARPSSREAIFSTDFLRIPDVGSPAVEATSEPYESSPGTSFATFRSGELIARQGERGGGVFRLLTGRVRACIVPGESGVPGDDAIGRHAWPVAVASFRGDMPGESGALLDDRASSLIAETDVTLELTHISTERLSRMILDRPDLGLALAEDLGRRVAEAVYGIALFDGRLTELRIDVERHELAFDEIVEALSGHRGGLARVADRAREAAALRRREAGATPSRASRRSSVSRRSERRQASEAVRDYAQLEGAGSGETVELAAGEWLAPEGARIPWASGREGGRAPFFLVLAGEIEIVARGRRLGSAGENELAGVLAAILPGMRRRLFGLRAARSTKALCIPSSNMESLVTARPVLAVHLVRILSKRLKRAHRALGELQENIFSVARNLDGAERSLASDFAALGADLVDWSDEVPDEVRGVGRHLAGIRGCARRAGEKADGFKREFLGGAPLSDLLARREFARAGSHLRRAFDLLRGGSRTDGEADASEEICWAAEAVYDYVGIGTGMPGTGVSSARGAGDDSARADFDKMDLERHSVGTAAWALLMAERIGCGVRESRDLVLAGLLHDVGMLRAETDSEFVMDSHPTEYATGYLARLKGLPPVVVPAVCEHHECVDGSGYPRRLSGERICLGGKLLAVANKLDLLLAKGLCGSDVASALTAEASRYDPTCLSAALELIAESPAQVRGGEAGE